MNRFDNVIFGQKAFILNDEKELFICKRKSEDEYEQNWDVPGKSLTENDSLLESITKNIKDESGLDLQRILLVLSTSKSQESIDESPVIMRSIYLAHALGNVKLSSDYSEYKWINVADIGNYNFPPDADFQAVILKIPEIINSVDLQKKYSLIF